MSCNDTKTETAKDGGEIEPKNSKMTEVFKSKVTIILAEKLDSDSGLINIQDFVDNGVTFIPVFTTMEKLTKSNKGIDMGKQIIEIDGIFLLSLLNGNETLRINPSLEDEEYYNASDLISEYRMEIDSLNGKMNGIWK